MARLFGCLLNVEADEGGGGGGGNSIAGEVCRSGMQPEGEAMSIAPLVERENNPYLRFTESKPDSGSSPMDSESDLHSCFIDFFGRESFEVDEFHRAGPNLRPSECSFDIMEEEKIELGLGIGSGSGSCQVRGDSQVTGNKEIDSGRVEVDTDLTPGWDDLFGVEVGFTPIQGIFGEAIVVDEQLQWWEDSQNATWVSDPTQAPSLFSLEEEEEEEEEDEEEEEEDEEDEDEDEDEDEEEDEEEDDEEDDEDDDEEDEDEEEEEEDEGGEEPYMDNDLVEQEINNIVSRSEEWQVFLPTNDDGLFEDPDLMDLDYDVFLSTIDELNETLGDYDFVLPQTFDQDPGIMPRPPASKTVLDGLPLVEFTSQELSSANIVCAICTDDILVQEKVNRLPCSHYYHGGCIIPWLGISNTCPVCRYELPTDDPEYERNRRSQRQDT